MCDPRSSKALLLLTHLGMKHDSITETSYPAASQAGIRLDWVRVMTLSLVVTGSFLLQGCLAGAWVALVSVDSMRGSDPTFGPFEQSWVAPRDQWSDVVKNLKVTSVAVLPVDGDPEMGARLATLLQQETTLRVEVPTSIATGLTAVDPSLAKADDADRSALAKDVTRDLGVDTVLVSRVVAGSPSHPSDWGRKAEGSQRLYLYLMNREGHLLWKDELSFTLVKGSTSPRDASVQTDLNGHVMQHVKELRLDELGYLPKKALYALPRKVGILTR